VTAANIEVELARAVKEEATANATTSNAKVVRNEQTEWVRRKDKCEARRRLGLLRRRPAGVF
jgi:hypothetical protein